MTVEQFPDFPSESGASIIRELQIPDTVQSVFGQANRERRRLFDAVHSQLEKLPYNPPEGIGRLAITAFHKLWVKGDDGATWERNAVIGRRRYDDLRTIAWHVIINDFSHTEDDTNLNYAEYVLPIGRRIMDFRYNDTVIDMSQPRREDFVGIAYIQSHADRFKIYRGQGCYLLPPPLHWNITEAPERYIVHDELEWLLIGLQEMAASASFEEGVKGNL